tara:strand:- start:1370 stop:2113 length:744 start_codon:yes stop_codon:yes gene_type:complete
MAAMEGYQSLAVQWTYYDNVDFMLQDAHLLKVLQAAVQYDFTIWLGLRADSDYFEQMQQPADARQRYFRHQLARNQLQLSRLKATLPIPVENLAGWYLPVELNDSDFVTPAQRAWLDAELSLFSRNVSEPLAISVFSNGQLTDTDYLQALQQLSGAGLAIWLQDDAGAGFKSAEQRRALLKQLPCDYAVIAEHFRTVTDSSQSFKARRAATEEIILAQQAVKPCHTKVVFSLRYLPIAKDILTLPNH